MEKRQLDKTFLILAGVLLLINLPAFLKLVYPHHDTMFSFQVYYFYYNELFQNGELPWWMPFGHYGLQSELQLTSSLSAFCWLTFLLGLVFRIEDVHFLFTLTTFFEQLLLLAGTYLLAGRVYKHKTTAIFVTVTVICSTVLFIQYDFNFRAYNYLPLIIYFIVVFFDERKVRYLAIAMAVSTVSIFGMVYSSVLVALTVTIIFIVLGAANIKDWRLFLNQSRRDVIWSAALFTACVIVLGCFYSYLDHALDHAEGLVTGRDAETMTADLETFLTYTGETIGLHKFARLFNPRGAWILGDVSLHVGYLPLLYLVFALRNVRNALFFALLAVVVVLTMLSLGKATPVAEFLYNYFPMMKYYRHIGHAVGNFNFILPLMAGFGLDWFLASRDAGGPGGRGKNTLKIDEAVLAFLVIVGSIIYSRVSSNTILPDSVLLVTVVSLLFIAVLFYLRRYYRPTTHYKVFVISAVVFQMLCYQALAGGLGYKLSNVLYGPIPREVLSVSQYPFMEMRSDYPEGERSRAAVGLLEKSSITYSYGYNFAQFDPCRMSYRAFYLNTNVMELLRTLAGGPVRQDEFMVMVLPEGDRFDKVMACSTPKLRLSQNVIFTESDESRTDESNDESREESNDESNAEAAEVIMGRSDLDTLIVLSGVPEDIRSSWKALKPGGAGKAGHVAVMDYKANEVFLKAEVDVEAGAWLLFSDAWHPGWKAYVDGKEVPVVRANIAFKAILLEKGQREVRFVFDNRRQRVLGYFLVSLEGIWLVFFFLFIVPMVLFTSRGNKKAGMC